MNEYVGPEQLRALQLLRLHAGAGVLIAGAGDRVSFYADARFSGGVWFRKSFDHE